MRVLVTGREGQLARSLADRGVGRGFDLLFVGRPDLDLERPGSAAAAIAAARPDVVVNAAAYTAVDRAEDEPARAMRVNGEAAGEIAAAARDVGAAVIQISTDYVFDGRSPRPYREDDPTGPIGVYGRSKLVGEEAVRAANPRHAILRTAWVYSPFGHNFVKTMLRLAEGRDLLTVVGDQHGNPTSALDLADGILALLGKWRADGGPGTGATWHLSGTGRASWAEFAQAILAEAAALGLPSAEVKPIPGAEWPTRARRPANSCLDCSRFAQATGFVMPDWRQSLREVLSRLASERAGEVKPIAAVPPGQ